MNTYYFPIKSENLAVYFASAIIAPVKYKQSKDRNIDIQSNFPDFLFLSTKKGIADSDCALELVITEEEKEDASLFKEISKDYFILNKPLPIVRVKKVWFNNENQMKQTITSINLNTAFIPESIVSHCNFDMADVPEIKDVSDKDWTRELQYFDQFLGGLALMRLVTIENMNFSLNYFNQLASYNTVIEQELLNAGLSISKVYKDGYYKTVSTHVSSPITINVIEKVENKPIKSQFGIIDKENLNDAAYILAILLEYKASDKDNGARKNIDELIKCRFSNIRKGQEEEVAFFYGLNRGYSVFNKHYGDVEVKYKLNSQLDYYTIESVYQRAVNNIGIKNNEKSAEFIYIDQWCPKLTINNTMKNEYVVLDTIVVAKKKEKVGSLNYCKDLFNSFLEKIKNALIEGSFYNVFEEIVNQVSTDKDSEYEDKIEEDKQHILEDLSLQLRPVNNTLFDTIDKNKNGILELDEIYEFINKLNDSKKTVETLTNINKERESIEDGNTYNNINKEECIQNEINEINEKIDKLKDELKLKKNELKLKNESKSKKNEPKVVVDQKKKSTAKKSKSSNEDTVPKQQELPLD